MSRKTRFSKLLFDEVTLENNFLLYYKYHRRPILVMKIASKKLRSNNFKKSIKSKQKKINKNHAKPILNVPWNVPCESLTKLLLKLNFNFTRIHTKNKMFRYNLKPCVGGSLRACSNAWDSSRCCKQTP